MCAQAARSRLFVPTLLAIFPVCVSNSKSNTHSTPPPTPHPASRRRSSRAPQTAMADKLRAQQQLEALQARYIGIGSADTSKHEWTSNMARDSLASYIGHPPLLQYMSIGLGQPREKTRVQFLERMIQPVGPPPKVRE
jgi:splicing factor 3B subunit 5